MGGKVLKWYVRGTVYFLISSIEMGTLKFIFKRN